LPYTGRAHQNWLVDGTALYFCESYLVKKRRQIRPTKSCGEIDILLNSIDLEILVICQEFFLTWSESNAFSGMGNQKASI
jgi:hypothetical protein